MGLRQRPAHPASTSTELLVLRPPLGGPSPSAALAARWARLWDGRPKDTLELRLAVCVTGAGPLIPRLGLIWFGGAH